VRYALTFVKSNLLKPIRWVLGHPDRATLICTILILLCAIIGTAGVFYAAQSLKIQSTQYQEEEFNRKQGAINLAWHMIADANLKLSELGQSEAILFLTQNGLLKGNVTLQRSKLYLSQPDPAKGLDIDLHRSALCGTSLYFYTLPNTSASLANTLLRGTRLSGRLVHPEFTGSDLQQALLDNVRFPKANFIAVNLKSGIITGGSFENVDFQGADMRNVQTRRGFRGAGTKYDDLDFELGFTDYAYPVDYPPIFKSITDNLPWQSWTYADEDHLVDFKGARFLNADLRGADLTNSTINQAQIDEACTDQNTKLPSPLASKKSCTPENWILQRRQSIQQPTYYAGPKETKECESAAADPSWR
jgi:uncharacterized protein YjbI with pentapeptide repeats